jgi:Leucine-rich repeat (LRR) protein
MPAFYGIRRGASMSKRKVTLSGVRLVVAICLLLLPLSAMAAIPDQERTALIDLYNATFGQRWLSNSGWMDSAGTECTWFGVTCNSDQTSVTAIDLKENLLSRTLPQSIGNLTNLQLLNLSNNTLYGDIPISMGSLANLQTLDLSNNWLSIATLESLTSLCNLRVLNLSSNLIRGTIPDSMGNLSRLQILDFSNNYLGGSISSSLGNLTNLQSLGLSNDSLGGSIPESLGSISGLQSLLLDGNSFDSIPATFENLTNLRTLQLDHNDLTSIPSFLGNMGSLRKLTLSNNRLSGNILEFLGNLKQLENLDLGNNQFSGGIPEFFGSMTNLQTLNLSQNPLGGTLPSFLQDMSSLTELGLNNCQISGGIPESIGNLNNLQSLQLAYNQLTGNIPASLGNLVNLYSLGLMGNQLTGNIPTSLGNLVHLVFLTLGQNQLSGPLPEIFGSMTELSFFDASSNLLSGAIPSSVASLTKLYSLDLYNNQLSGTIPEFAMKYLGYLNLSHNHLSGPIPASLNRFEYLYLDGNMLSGQIPDTFTSDYTRFLTLEYNAISLDHLSDSLIGHLREIDSIIYIQTIAPKNFISSTPTTSSVQLSWSPILYRSNSGRYEIFKSLSSGGPYTLAGATASKTDSAIALSNLEPNTRYYLVIRTVTDPNSDNKNTVTSDFSPEISITTAAVAGVTITTDPAGLNFTVDGITYTSAQAFIWTAGSNHTIYTISPQETSRTRYLFSGWSDGGEISHTITVPPEPITYTANFATQHRLTAAVSPASGGRVETSPASTDGYFPSGQQVQLTAIANTGYSFSAWSGDLAGTANSQTITMSSPRNVTATFIPSESRTLIIDSGGAKTASTGGNGTVQSGYASVAVSSGTTPYGTAVFSFKQNGIIVSEAGVPASPATTSARVFVDYRPAVNAIPGRSDSGIININTGIAIVNYGSATANITYTLHDLNGDSLAVGHGTLQASHHLACFVDGLKNVAASDFNLPSDFGHNTQFGSLNISSDQPLSVLALRGTTNQRNEFLITTTPVADLTYASSAGSIYFPQFVDGGGYTTSLILMNTSGSVEAGSFQIMDKDGHPLTVTQAEGNAGSTFTYSMQPGGLYHFQTDGVPTDIKAGWVRLTPDAGTFTPVGSGVFGYNPAGILVSESGIPSAVATTHARIYVDLSGDHNIGLAIANIASTESVIAINAFQTDGMTAAGSSKLPLHLTGSGYTAAFVDSFVSGLAEGFTGVLDISSDTPFAALTLRSLMNDRDEFLMTTFPIADMMRPAPSPVIFPHIVNGGGYTSQFILISAGQAASASLSYYDEDGAATDFGD